MELEVILVPSKKEGKLYRHADLDYPKRERNIQIAVFKGKRISRKSVREIERFLYKRKKEERTMFLMENWYLVVALMAVAGMVGVCIGRFLKMPTSEQRERVKEWLLWAVTQAEAELGSGTGKLKLRQTYDLFIQRFPALAMAVSFDTFALWVDEALEEMRKLLKENKTVRELVKG